MINATTLYCTSFLRLHSSLSILVYQTTAGLTSICPQKEAKDHRPILRIMCGQRVESPGVTGFLDHDNLYKSVAIQNPCNTRMAPFRTTADQTQDPCV